ncbi:CRE-DYCI-1 protein [Caenorhabditis remanei]|uniref:CRE-DYCI-1 protein n=1 Tax=Caenorhabditis remanei TaxID=31234 RepID=E3N3X6_CAERE|nr:CRE-DYCI-1 protein [Caenorhabditis remanei]
MSTTSEQRKLELDRKKQKLAELKSQRKRDEESRVQNLLRAPTENGNAQNGASHRQTLSSDQVEEILREVGISAEPTIREESPAPPRGAHSENHLDPMSASASHPRISSLLSVDLEFSSVQTASTDNKDSAIYSKGTQTDDERISVGEFSLGSQEFDYDDDMIMPIDHGQFRGRAHSHDQDSPLPYNEEIAKLLGQTKHADKTLTRQDTEEKKSQHVQTVQPLSDEEKNRLTLDPEFLDSFNRSCKVIGRALNEDIDIFINYTKDPYEKAVTSDDLLHLAQVYYDETWTAKRLVTGMAFSEHHSDLLAVSYGPCDVPNEPPGVIVVWNTKSKRITAEFIVYCQSEIQSVAFARFHAHLLLAGCESGQICVWDNRLTSRKLPINRVSFESYYCDSKVIHFQSPLTTQAHTQPVSCLAVVGTKNAHNFVSLSRDGKICSWNVDNLTQPVDGKEMMAKDGKPASATRMSFPIGEMQTFVVGTDTGDILAASRNGADPTIIKTDVCYKGHNGTLTGIEFHRASGVVDFSHLFISSSHDWTIKLWSTKDANLKFSFESHPDLVLDVAWSPVHPAVFASVDADGNIFVWNLNEDVEGPVARLRAGAEGETVYMNKLIWSTDGKHVFVGDDEGRVHMYDVRESLYVLKSEEWNRFARVLSDMKESNEEAEKYNL